ncbi:MAG TPA: T9SS type A sorting domain-containing protein [Flavisolibacter sp.]|jgi:hypothetical protein
MKKLPDTFIRIISFAPFLFCTIAGSAQAVTEIVTDYKGFWQSGAAAINPVKPDNSHNLIAFTFNGIRYSTGVNNALLSSHGLSFSAADFQALSVDGINGTVGANTKIGLGALYDGVASGASSPAPAGGLPGYLSDGLQGLNLGTGVANLPVGQLVFSVSNLQPAAIGDGIPDILVTQIADPSGTADTYQFTNSSDATIGTSLNISFSSMGAVGNWTADFYEASQNPMTLGAGFTQTDRPIRLWAADFSAFGITNGNFASIAKFKINLAGNSDVAFVAYNATGIILLPVNFTFFKADVANKNVQLSWQTASTKDAAYFAVEESSDGRNFSHLGKVPATNFTAANNYFFTHVQGAAKASYYRLKQVDLDGSFMYSKIVKVNNSGTGRSVQAYPNPVQTKLTVTHPWSIEGHLEVWNAGGVKLLEKKVLPESWSTEIELNHLPSGVYTVVLQNGERKETIHILKQ